MDPYCPICGQKKKDGESLVAAPGMKTHCCPEATLRGIDATMRVEEREEKPPNFGSRLELGFRMLWGKFDLRFR